MGWTKSEIQNEVLSRCKHRIQFIKEAVSTHKAFAAAHSGYALCLKNTGAALSDYISEEVSHHSSSTAAPASPRVFLPRRLLSSPSFPNPASNEPDSAGPATLRRALSMSELAAPVLRTQMNPATLRRAVSMPEMELSAESKSIWPIAPGLDLVPPMKKLAIEVGKTGKMMSLIQIFYNLDNQFLKASEGAHETSKLLGVSRLEGNTTHAMLLATILAWEEKLYDEMKAGETAKHEFQKKIASLTKKNKQGSDSVSLEKRKAAASDVHIKYIAKMQSIDSTVEQINGLRDEQLYPQLLQLLDKMATMWETMRYHHEIQGGVVHALKSVDSFQPQDETSKYRNDRILQLYFLVLEWYTYFCRLIDSQKDHVRALHNWLNLDLVPTETNPPIHELVQAWNDAMDKLPDEIARNAIQKFAALILKIFKRDEEMKMREKCEAVRSELDRKSRQYDDWCVKNGVNEELDSENPLMIGKEERECVVISLKQKFEELQVLFRQEREKSLARVRRQLLDLFRAMSEIARACSVMYTNLRSIAEN